jgi:uncharacterized membrane protein
MSKRILVMGLPGAGQALIASGIAFAEIMTKVFLFWLHERVWNRISWGKK